MPAKETRRIVVEGNLARVERTIVERETRLEDLIENLSNLEPLSSGILPEGCCYYGHKRSCSRNQTRLYVILHPAHRRPMQYRPHRLVRLSEDERNRTHLLNVSWPPTLWFFTLVDNALSSIKARAVMDNIFEHGDDTKMYRTYLPNFYGGNSTGLLCVGTIGVDANLPVAQRLNITMREVFQSAWNDDLSTDYSGSGVTDLLDWANKSSGEDDFWKSMSFHQVLHGSVGETFGQICRSELGEPPLD